MNTVCVIKIPAGNLHYNVNNRCKWNQIVPPRESPYFGIIGMEQILGSNKSLFSRFAWCVIFIICWVAFLYQFTDRILYYYSEPVSTTVVVTRNQSITFPAVTFCPSYFTSLILLNLTLRYLAVADDDRRNGILSERCPLDHPNHTFLQDNNDIDVNTLWPLYLLNKQGIEAKEVHYEWVKFNHPNRTLPLELAVTDTESPWARCLTVNPVHKIYIEGSATVEIFVNALHLFPVLSKYRTCDNRSQYEPFVFEFDVQIHAREVPQKYATIYYPILLRGAQTRNYRLNIKQFFNKNTKHHPCEEDAREIFPEIEKCVEKELIKKLRCRVPYVRSTILPPCKTGLEFRNTSVILLREILRNKSHLDHCLKISRRHCQETASSVAHKMSEFFPPYRYYASIQFDIDDQFFEAIHEELIYRLPALIGDIGGSMGIFLGICILQIAEIIDRIFKRLLKSMIK